MLTSGDPLNITALLDEANAEFTWVWKYVPANYNSNP